AAEAGGVGRAQRGPPGGRPLLHPGVLPARARLPPRVARLATPVDHLARLARGFADLPPRRSDLRAQLRPDAGAAPAAWTGSGRERSRSRRRSAAGHRRLAPCFPLIPRGRCDTRRPGPRGRTPGPVRESRPGRERGSVSPETAVGDPVRAGRLGAQPLDLVLLV